MVRHPIAALVGAAAIAALAAPAAADAYLRVISQKAPVHTGPGAAYRELYTAERGEVFQVLERGGDGFWFRVELEDGTTGWILGELVFPFEVVDDENPGVFVRMGRAIRRAMLGPSPVPYSDVEISFSAGVLDNEGTFLLRPAWLLDQYFGTCAPRPTTSRRSRTRSSPSAPAAASRSPSRSRSRSGSTIETGPSSTPTRPPTDRSSAVDWRSSSSALLALLLAALALAGCGRFAVRPSEKEHLADRTMRFDADRQEASAEDHVQSNREGSAGGRGTSGGGCGCN